MAWKDVQYQNGKFRSNNHGMAVTDVIVDGQSVVNLQGEAEITMPTVPSETTDLSDIDITNIQDGQILKWDGQSQKWINANESGGGGGGTTFEIVTDSNASYDNNTTVTLTLTKRYSRPYVFPVNCLPLSSWSSGARVVVQTGTINYSSSNNRISFRIYVSSAQNYTCDYMIIDTA